MYPTSFARFGGRMACIAMLVTASLPALVSAAPTANLNEEQKLVGSALPLAAGGQSVAISDDGMVAVLGAPTDGNGAAYVFTRSGALWSAAPVATLRASDAAAGDNFGAAVSISGDINTANIAVGAPGRSSGAGAVYLFTGSGAAWTQNVASPLTSSATSAGALGSSVSVQGFRIAAGAPKTTAGKGANAGVAIVFDSTDAAHALFTSSTFRASGGQARVGANFGTSVSLSGNTVLVGAPNYGTGHKASGNVFVFVSTGGSWTQQASIRPGNITNNFAGTAVSLFSNTAAFGAPGNSNNKGAVYVYNRTGTTWTQTASVSGGAAGDQFGSSVAQLGTFLTAGAPSANAGAGAAYEYGKSGNSYVLVNNLIASDNATGDSFGTSVAVNSGRALVGAPDAAGTSGAGYVFKFLNASRTVIDGTSDDPNPSNTGVPYSVNVHVDDNGASVGTPSGTVDVNDGNGGACTVTLDNTGHGSCQLTSTFFGALTLNANYNGDFTFSPSTAAPLGHTITGNHLVFNPAPPTDVLQGTQFVGTVEVHDGQPGGGQLISSNSTTQVMITITDSCGTANAIGPVTVVGGIATFNAIGPRFYTLGTNLSISATSENDATATGNANINVVANPDFIFAGNFEVDATGCPPAGP
jgi:hypothetical protein